MRPEWKICGSAKHRLGLIIGPNITFGALVMKTADPAQCIYIGNLKKQIWALIMCLGPGPEALSLDWPTI